jgi:hypothetical protein
MIAIANSNQMMVAQVPNAQSVHSHSSQFDKSKLIIKKSSFGNDISDKHSIAKCEFSTCP